MEILDQIEGRIKQAMQTIEELQNRVKELEGEKAQYEEKLSSLLQQMDSVGQEDQADAGHNGDASNEPMHGGFDGHHQEHHHF